MKRDAASRQVAIETSMRCCTPLLLGTVRSMRENGRAEDAASDNRTKLVALGGSRVPVRERTAAAIATYRPVGGGKRLLCPEQALYPSRNARPAFNSTDRGP